MCGNNEQKTTSKEETWSRGTNSRLPFDVNVMLNHNSRDILLEKDRHLKLSCLVTSDKMTLSEFNQIERHSKPKSCF